jgi:hypothetical protein
MDEFHEVILKYSKIDKSFLIIADAEFPTIDTGILFIMATWSAPSLIQFKILTETLSKLDLNGLKIHVLDTDNITREDIPQHGISIPHGWGETYWFKNHKIKHFLNNRENDVSKIVLYTNELFAQ